MMLASTIGTPPLVATTSVCPHPTRAQLRASIDEDWEEDSRGEGVLSQANLFEAVRLRGRACA